HGDGPELFHWNIGRNVQTVDSPAFQRGAAMVVKASKVEVAGAQLGRRGKILRKRDASRIHIKKVRRLPLKPTVSPLLTLVTSRNILLLQSLPNSIPDRQDNVRRRKDELRVGTAARGSIARLSRLPRRLPSDGGSSARVRRALSTRAGDRGWP